MKRLSAAICVVLGMVLASVAVLRAEVKTEEKSQMKLEGMMGRVVGMFAGKAAKEGVISTIAIKGNRRMTMSEAAGEIVDLGEQKIYLLDMKKKSYEVVTFQEMRRRMQEQQEKAAKSVKEDTKEAAPEKQPEKQMEIDFSLKESGQKRTINGYECREVVMTATAREKGKTLEESGGMVMTSHVWLAPAIAAAKEIAEFNLRYLKAFESPYGAGGSAEQMAAMSAMYPAFSQMMGKVQTESVNMDGTQILTETVIETVRSPEQMSQERKQERESSDVTSIRGIGGLLGRKMARKKEDEGSQPKNRATIMTMNHELLKVATSVSPEDVAIPAGFKEKK